jgi:hypothetical protein
MLTTEIKTETMDTMPSETSTPAELRAYAERTAARNKVLEDKLSAGAFKEAGFPAEAKQRKALEGLYKGDRTDAAAIRTFAEEYGLTPEGAPRGEVVHVQPSATVPADARTDQLDAVSKPVTATTRTTEELDKESNALLAESIKDGADNMDLIQASIAAALMAEASRE